MRGCQRNWWTPKRTDLVPVFMWLVAVGSEDGAPPGGSELKGFLGGFFSKVFEVFGEWLGGEFGEALEIDGVESFLEEVIGFIGLKSDALESGLVGEGVVKERGAHNAAIEIVLGEGFKEAKEGFSEGEEPRLQVEVIASVAGGLVEEVCPIFWVFQKDILFWRQVEDEVGWRLVLEVESWALFHPGSREKWRFFHKV